MRLVMITSIPLPPCEGVGFYVWNLSRHLTQLGHQVQIITRGGLGSTSRDVVDGIPIWRTPFLPLYPFHAHLHGLFVDRLLNKLDLRPDLVHLHLPLVARPRTELPFVVTVHTTMWADSRAVSPNTPLGLLVKLQAPFSIRLEKNVLDAATAVATVSRSVAEELPEYGVPGEKVTVLGNGADTSIFCPNGRSPAYEDPYFFTAGRLGPRKGLEDLLEAAAYVVSAYPQVRFRIAGNGPMEGRLRSLVASKSLQDNVTFLGHVANRQQMADLYRGAVAYVHPAHYEGLPTVLIEAMACGSVVVATGVSGALDVVRNGENGILVEPRAPATLAQAMIRVLENPQVANQLGNKARKTIDASYSWQVVSRDYARMYQEALEATAR